MKHHGRVLVTSKCHAGLFLASYSLVSQSRKEVSDYIKDSARHLRKTYGKRNVRITKTIVELL